MNDIQIFNNPDFGAIRTIIIDGEPWFVGKDLAIALGYVKPETAIRNNVDKGDTLKQGVSDTNGHTQHMLVINEAGMYALIFGSKLDRAKSFKRWVTSEVLPQIRKTGSYKMDEPSNALPTSQINQNIRLLAQGHVELSEKVDAIKNDFDQFREECPLFPVEAEQIVNAAKKKGVSVLGGKDSEAYRDRSLVQSVYRDMYSQLHRNFDVSTYKALTRKQLQKAIGVIESYQLPIALADKVESANLHSQMSLF